MPPVFGHGRLRLYLLKLLEEAPRHGYEIIRLLEERFQGLYAPSAGTVYPRLAKLEKEGLVTHTTEGGRKIYSVTAAGLAELASRREELADLELEIHESVSELAAEIREDVRGFAKDLREEIKAAARQAHTGRPQEARGGGEEAGPWGGGPWGDRASWRRAKRDMKEQARRAAKEEHQRAREEAQQAQERARQEMLRAKKRMQEQLTDHVKRGDWPTGVVDTIGDLIRELASLSDPLRHTRKGPDGTTGNHTDETATAGPPTAEEMPPRRSARAGGEPPPADTPPMTSMDPPPNAWTQGAWPQGAWPAGGWPAQPDDADLPDWARDEAPSSADPTRELERLLDRFRDDVRDAARDHGVSATQLTSARRHLSTVAAQIGALLRNGDTAD